MDEPVRLQKYLSAQGIASRREVESMIEAGRISVNGRRAQLGDKVTPGLDTVKVDGQTIAARRVESHVLAMHKPKGYLCSHSDPHHSRTIFALIPPPFNEQRYLIAGRLDKESEGLLLLCTDGALVQKLTHPSHRIIKKYRVQLDQPFDERHIARMLKGITWEGERLKAERVIPERGKTAEARKRIEVHLEHGRKREIRRLLFALGYDVERLQRFQIGGITLRGIGEGRVRELSKVEIERLFS